MPTQVQATSRVDPRWRGVRKLLAVRLDNMGDLLMTTPALASLRHALPHASITALVSPAGAAAARYIDALDSVLVADAPWTRPARAGSDMLSHQPTAQLIERLAAERFDAAVIFTVCTQSALPAAMLCWLAGIPLRLAHCRENPYSLLTDWVPDTEVVADGMRHEVSRQLALIDSVGLHAPGADERLQFHLHPCDRVRLWRRLAALGIERGCGYVVVHPGATASSRRYPAERFGAAADAVARRSGCLVLYTGDAAEVGLIEQARTVMRKPSVSLAGRLDLGELAALIQDARVLMANNTGPSHLAAALGTPVVTLYALTNPQHTPWQARARVLNHPVPCRHCLKSTCPQGHHDCLQRVSPEEVATAALGLMCLPP